MSFDSYNLIPAHVRASDKSKAYRIVCDAINQVYKNHQDLIDRLPDIRSPRFGNADIFEAWERDKRFSGLQFFPNSAKSTLFTDLSNQYRMKGTSRASEAIARLLGFNVTFNPLWGTLAHPDPDWIQNPKNDTFFTPEPDTLPGDVGPSYPLIGYKEDPGEFCQNWEASNPGTPCPWGQKNDYLHMYRTSYVLAPVLDISNQFIEIPNDTDLRNFNPALLGNLRAWIQGFRKEVYAIQYDQNDPYRFVVIGKVGETPPSGGVEDPPGNVENEGYQLHVFHDQRVFPSNYFDVTLVFPPRIREALLEREILLSDTEIENINNGSLSQEEMEKLFERVFWSTFFVVKEFLPAKAVPRKLNKNYISAFFTASVWRDLSSNENNFLQKIGGKNPKNWLLGNGVRFQESYMTLEEPENALPSEFNNGKWRLDLTLQNITTRQVVYSQGSFDSGALVYINNGRLVFGVWGQGWGPFYNLHNIETPGDVSLEAKLESGELRFFVNETLEETFSAAGAVKTEGTEGKYAIIGRSFGQERFSGGVLQGSFYFRGIIRRLVHEIDSEIVFHQDAGVRDLRVFTMREGIYTSQVSQANADDLVRQDFESWLENPEASLCNLEEFIPPGESTGEGDDLLDPANIEITQEGDPIELELEDTSNVSVKVENKGQIGAINSVLSIQITFPAGLDITASNFGGFNHETSSGSIILTRNLGLLNPGSELDFDFDLIMPNSADTGTFDIEVVSSVQASNLTDPSVSDTLTLELEVENVTTLFSWEFEDEGYLLFEDLSDQSSARHDGSKRGPYTDPENGPDMGSGNFYGSPWSFTQADQLGLRLDFEDDNTCHINAPDQTVSSQSTPNSSNVMPSSGPHMPERPHHGIFNPNVAHGGFPNFGPAQTGSATLIVKSQRHQLIKFTFSGMGERANPFDWDYWDPGGSDSVHEEMRLFVEPLADPENPPAPGTGHQASPNEEWIAWARAPGGSTGPPPGVSPTIADCRAGMGPIVTFADFPNQHGTNEKRVNQYELQAGEVYRFRVHVSTNDSWYHVGSYYQFTVDFEDL